MVTGKVSKGDRDPVRVNDRQYLGRTEDMDYEGEGWVCD